MPSMAVSNRRDESPPIGHSNIVAEREPRWVFRVNIVWLGGVVFFKKSQIIRVRCLGFSQGYFTSLQPV